MKIGRTHGWIVCLIIQATTGSACGRFHFARHSAGASDATVARPDTVNVTDLRSSDTSTVLTDGQSDGRVATDVASGIDGGSSFDAGALDSEFMVARDARTDALITSSDAEILRARLPPRFAGYVSPSANAESAVVAYDDVARVLYLGLTDSLYAWDGVVFRQLSNTNSSGADNVRSVVVDRPRRAVYFVAQVSTNVFKLFRATPGGAVQLASDSIMDTHPLGDDDPRQLTIDEAHDTLYLTARSTDVVARDPTDTQLYRVSSRATSALKIVRADAHTQTATVAASGAFPFVFSLDTARDVLFFTAQIAPDVFRLFRTSSTGRAVVASDAISAVRTDFPNDFPVFLSYDGARDELYFHALVNRATVDYRSRPFRASSLRTSANPLVASEALVDLASEGPNEVCVKLGDAPASGTLYLYCTCDVYRGIFRIASGVSGTQLAGDAVSGLEYVASQAAVADATRDYVYFVAKRFADESVFRMTSAHSSSRLLTEAFFLTDTCASCVDAPHELTFEQANGIVYFSGAISTSARKLFRLGPTQTQADPVRATAALTATNTTSLDDDPTNLFVDPVGRWLYFSAHVRDGDKKLFALDLDDPGPPLRASEALTDTRPAGNDAPEVLFIDPVSHDVIVRSRDATGVMRVAVLR